MKHSVFALALVSVPLGVASAQKDAIPLESAILIEKLADYDKQLAAEQAKSVKEKRASAIALLAEHKKAESEAGRLDPALDIEKAIGALKDSPKSQLSFVNLFHSREQKTKP